MQLVCSLQSWRAGRSCARGGMRSPRQRGPERAGPGPPRSPELPAPLGAQRPGPAGLTHRLQPQVLGNANSSLSSGLTWKVLHFNSTPKVGFNVVVVVVKKCGGF